MEDIMVEHTAIPGLSACCIDGILVEHLDVSGLSTCTLVHERLYGCIHCMLCQQGAFPCVFSDAGMEANGCVLLNFMTHE